MPMAQPVTKQSHSVETILFVEDEVLIRWNMADYLRVCGYRVIEANNAAEALALLGSGAPVDLVFTDVQMPGVMDGFGLARWLRANFPQIKVILTSGVVRSAEIAADLCEHGPLLSKPYHEKILLERIKRILADTNTKTGRRPKGTSNAA